MKAFLALFIGFVLCSNFVYPQDETQYLKDYPGKAHYKYVPAATAGAYSPTVSAAEEAVVNAKLDAIYRFFLTNPAFSSPKGLELFFKTRFSYNNDQVKQYPVLKYEMDIQMYPWISNNGKPTWECSLCNVSFEVYVNRPDKVFEGRSISGGEDPTDENGYTISVEPVIIGEKDGCKIYSNGTIVVSSGEKAVFVPVTVKEYDLALIRSFEKKNKEHPEEQASGNMFISRIKEEMATWSGTELNSAAFTGDKIGACPYRLEYDQVKPLVKLNPGLFDKTKPRTAAQLIIIYSYYVAAGDQSQPFPFEEGNSYSQLRLVELMKTINFEEMKKVLD